MRIGRTCGALVPFFACLVAWGGGTSSARILKVERVDNALPEDQACLYIPRFFESEFTDVGEEFRVIWSPGSGVEADAVTVRFTYKQRRAREPQSLEVSYPFAFNNQRAPRFGISGKAYRRGGMVTAWQVLILHHGEVVAERVSGTWR